MANTCTCACTCGVCRFAQIIARRPGANPSDLDDMGNALATLVLDPEAPRRDQGDDTCRRAGCHMTGARVVITTEVGHCRVFSVHGRRRRI